MRNPFDRRWSHYWFACSIKKWKALGVGAVEFYQRHGPEIFHNYSKKAVAEFLDCAQTDLPLYKCAIMTNDFEARMHPCKGVRLGVSLYYLHLLRWFSIFPREKFLFLKTEELFSNTQTVMQTVWDFIEIRPQLKTKTKVFNRNTWIGSMQGFAL